MADFAGVRLLLFRIADTICAAEARRVREIMAPVPTTRIPGAPSSVIGVINVRGNLVTLVDSRRSLGRPPTDERPSIVLLDVGSKTVAFAVDEVLDLISVPADDLAERAELPGFESRFVRAVGRHEEHTFVLLDTDELFGPILAF